MTNLLRPFLFAKALYLDRRQRKRIESLEEETVAKVDQLLNDNIPIYLELGHSHLQANDWLTLDQNLNCDFYWDYRSGLPFPEGSIDVLFSRNTLQRLSSQQLDYLLKDCFRVLKPGEVRFFCLFQMLNPFFGPTPKSIATLRPTQKPSGDPAGTRQAAAWIR